MILVFDLDDTLYNELTFVKSGFHVVAQYLEENYNISKQQSLKIMLQNLQTSRKNVFNKMLLQFDIHAKKTLSKCISIYRNHLPTINLYTQAQKCLTSFYKTYPIYIVTDGNKIVQNNKLQALGLKQYTKHQFISHRYGIQHSKPSPYCFLQIQKREKVPCTQIVYIGDNPLHDFVGIKPLGFKTIRVHTGQHKNIVVPQKYDAEHHIKNLSQLTIKLLSKL